PRNTDSGVDDETQEAKQRVALIFSASDTGAVGEEFVEGLSPAVHMVEEFDVAPDTPSVESRREWLVHLCTAFKKLAEEAANCSEYSDVVDRLNKAFGDSADGHQRMKEAADIAKPLMGFDPYTMRFPEGVIRVSYGEVGVARQQVNALRGNIVPPVLIKTDENTDDNTDDETKSVLVVILGGPLADILKAGEVQQNVDIPDEGSHQASVFKVTVDISPRATEGDDIVYSATIMADVHVTRETLLAKFCEAQNWRRQLNLQNFLKAPVLDETTLKQVVCDDCVREIEGITPVYTQCRVSDDQEQHAAQLLKVQLNVPAEEFNNLTAALQEGDSPGAPEVQDIWPKQKEVAQRLFEKTQKVLGNRCIHGFKGVEFMVLTPAFQTLQQQTINRLAKSGVLPQDQAASECVIMYIKSAKHDQLFKGFKARVDAKKDTLFVLVADECHYGCTVGGAHDEYVNDPDLHRCDNFVLLGVSATPYNCLTKKSRVDKSNVIEWFEEDHSRTGGIYKSMEYYLGTVPFRPSPSACTLHVEVAPATEQGNSNDLTHGSLNDKSFTVDIKDKPFTAPDEVAEALSNEIASKISECYANASIKMIISFCKGSNRFLARNTTNDKRFKLRLGRNEAGILAKLGFTSEQLPLELAPGDKKEAAEEWEIGNHNEPGGRSLEDQRIRSDPGFTKLRTRFNSTFGARGDKKRRQQSKILTPNDNSLGKTTVALHDGHLLLAEYLFSLVCLSMFRKEGLTMRMKGPETGPVNEDFLSKLVTDDCLAIFNTKLTEVSTFNVGTKSDSCPCDISSVTNFVKEARISCECLSTKDEPNDDFSCLRRILREKLKASAIAGTTSAEYSWFNETDRVLRDLLREDSGGGHGRMIVMRVYEKEEQLSMQHCLRQARQELMLCRGPTEDPLFSVVCDNGDTNLSQDIEEYFLNRFNLQPEGAGHSTLSDRMKELRKLPGSRNTSLSYEDLINVPMILILCEKGRMGDTFPHSLGCFDLRLRGAGYFSSFEQELGRLCRYPEFCTIDGGSCCSYDDAKTLGRQALNRKRLVKVSTSAGRVSVVDTSWQLDNIVNTLALDCAEDDVTLEESVFPLPTALLPDNAMRKILKAIGEHRVTGAPISKCIRMPKMDLHMLGATNIRSKPNTLHDYSAYSPGDKHFDHHRTIDVDPKDPRRLILSAECQIGKTGAYLNYLSLLTSATSGLENVPSPPRLNVKVDGWPRQELSWLLPHWQTLFDIALMKNTYGTLLASKYTQGIARERVHLVVQSCKGDEWQSKYADLLVDSCGEHVQSTVGKQQINHFQKITLEAPFDKQGQPRTTTVCYESLKLAINWDGRFKPSLGVQLCTCERQCTCQGALAGGSFAKGLTLRMEELARNWGEHGCVDVRWKRPQDGDEGEKKPAVSEVHVRNFAAKQPPSTWANGETQSELTTCTFRHSQEKKENGEPQTLHVSIPTPNIWAKFLTPTDPQSRWIFTPSYNRAAPGSRQALLDRSVALPQESHDTPDVGTRYNINVLVVRWEQFARYRRHFGNQYVVLEMPSRMPCVKSKSGNESCTPEEGGIGYARHFIQQWSFVKGIPFAWMLDDNVQLCHELDVDTGLYNPCGFTHIMNSLERVLLVPDNTTIVAKNAQQSVSDHAVNLEACPPDLPFLRGQKKTAEETHMIPTTVADFCGKPDHYGVLGISRHGLGSENNEAIKRPFDVNHSVYSFCLLNVRSTVKQGAYYPIKRYWEDVEFNHIVDEKGLVVCMFRKFSHSKKNLQPNDPQAPLALLCSTPAFEHDDIAFNELKTTFEKIQKGLTMVIPTAYLDSLLEYLSCHVLGSINFKDIAYPSDKHEVRIFDEFFEFLPAVPEQTKGPEIELQTSSRSKATLIMLLGGLEFYSLCLLKHAAENKIGNRKLKKIVIVTRLPQRGGSTREHIGEWLQKSFTAGSNVKVQSTIVKPKGGGVGHGLLVLSFSSPKRWREDE
ncbi:unnamed protein product, partial [Pylaiella littoralis]